eukprot:4771186-Heterocapsa_arctica.AAC.1
MDANAQVGAGVGQTRCTGPFCAGNDNWAGVRLRFFMDACRKLAYSRKYDYQSWEAQQTQLLADAMADHRVKE